MINKEILRKPVIKIDYASAAGDPNPKYEKIDCGLGNSPFPFPNGVMETIKSISKSELAEYPTDPYSKGLDDLVRERFGLPKPRNEKTDNVFFSGQGSYGLLASVLSDLVSPEAPVEKGKVIGYGPQFTNIAYLADRAGLEYFAVQPPIKTSVDSKVVDLTKYLKKLGGRPQVVYVDTPNNPTGEIPSQETISELMDVTAKRGDLLIIDEAFGDAIPDQLSSVLEVAKRDNLIVIRSLAKVIGLASPRLGWAAMSENVGTVYDSVNLVFSIDTLTSRISRVAMNPEMLLTYLPEVRKKTTDIKTVLVNGLRETGIDVHSTENAVNILLTRGKNEFFKSLLEKGIVTEDGASFIPTHKGMDGSYVRFRIPGSFDQVEEILQRVREIK